MDTLHNLTHPVYPLLTELVQPPIYYSVQVCCGTPLALCPVSAPSASSSGRVVSHIRHPGRLVETVDVAVHLSKWRSRISEPSGYPARIVAGAADPYPCRRSGSLLAC